jgi:DMSO/TMAO reductase YedYZ molybdopterin-dependent catalytic subunit
MANPQPTLIRIPSVNPIQRVPARGLAAGLLSGAVGVCVGFLVSGVTGPVGSPVVATGQLMIDVSPPAVKDFAIRHFGSNDKMVLQIGVLVVLALFSAAIGVLARRRLVYGLAGVGLFGAVGLLAALTRPTATISAVWPTLAGTAAAALVLVLLTRGASPRARRAAAFAGSAQVASLSVSARPEHPEPPRREFMLLGAAAAGAAAVSYVGGRLLSESAAVTAAEQSMRLPAAVRPAPPLPVGADLRIPGLAPFITSNSAFYRVDTAIVLPQIPPSSWHLRVHGQVRRELTLSFDELLRRPLIEDYITLACVSNPVAGPYISNAKWLGASLGALLREAGIRPGADQLFCTSANGFTSGTPVVTAMDGRDAMLAVGMNGAPLPVEHGFPVRTVVPGLYGYVSACKWITDIEVTTYAANVAYWAQRGWSPQAPIKTESRIDVPNGQGPIRRGPTTIAGVAWAQHKGIDAVQVRVNGGPWRQARLAAVPGIDTWRQWAIDWDAAPGNHRIEARATDATGYTQTAAPAPPPPNGATGYPTVIVSVS